MHPRAGPIRHHREGTTVVARFGRFVLDSERRQLLCDGTDVHLTPKAFDLLTVLVGEAPRIVPKSELHRRLWPDAFVTDATLVGVVKELRRALDDDRGEVPFVRTARRVGYGFGRSIDRAPTPADPRRVARWVIVATRKVELADGENVIGRHAAVAVNLDAAGVSRRHARIVVSAAEARLEDLGSKNGTLVRDQRVRSPLVLRDGDPIQIGPVTIVYREAAAGGSTETLNLRL